MPPLHLAHMHLGLRCGRDGVRVVSPALSLDGDTRRSLAFVAALDSRRRNAARVLCSRPVALARGWAGAMAPPWGKPFQVGRLAVALLPAGSGPGAACLRVHTGGATVLDARAAHPTGWPGCEAPELREADAVLIDGRWATAASAEPAAVLEFLCHAATLQGCVQWHDPLLAWCGRQLLGAAGIGVRASPSLQSAWRRLPVARPARAPKVQVAFVGPEGGAAAGVAVSHIVHDPLQLPPLGQHALAACRTAAGTAIEALVAACGAREVLTTHAPTAAALAARLDGLGVRVTLLHATEQLALLPALE